MKYSTIQKVIQTRLMVKKCFVEKEIFFKKQYTLNTFRSPIENFGVVLKGKSIENLPKISKEFNDCFIVNNNDKELDVVGEHLLGKNIVHFSNESYMTAPLKLENYRKFGIEEIQLYKSSAWGKAMLYIIYIYQSMGLRTVFMPRHLLNVSGKLYGLEYAKKFPSTGLLAIYYALNIIKPRNLWIIGLDFYQSDYLIRRDHNTPIEIMRQKMKRTDAAGSVNKWIEEYQNVKFNIVSYFDGFKPQKNLTVINYSQQNQESLP